MKFLAIAVLKFYQLAVSPLLPAACRFYPTCSSYTLEAFEKYGFWKGLWFGARRLSRCHPFCAGGYDPVR